MTASHLAYVRSLPCCVPGCLQRPIHAHHVRTAATAGTGLKPADTDAVPLCYAHHDEGHRIGWRTFQARYGVDLAAEAWLCATGKPMP